MFKKVCILFCVCALLLLAACGANPGSPAQAAPESAASASEDAQNPVMNFVGLYGAGRASILVECEGSNGARFTVTWGSSAWEYSEWVMSGEFDPETLSVSYSDCVRTNLTCAEDGSVSSSAVVYEGGSGRILFREGEYALEWEDLQEHIADGTVFYGGAPVETDAAEEAQGDANYYSGVTAMDKALVEDIASSVRAAYLAEDWAAIAHMIRYPITLYPDVSVNSAEEFLACMDGRAVDASDRAAMEEETCRDMFFNGQGICMGSGQIWLLDPNYMTDAEPRLEIIAVSGVA